MLINAFKKLSSTLTDWKLVLVGGSVEDNWIKELKSLATGFNIDILPNTPSDTLVDLYSRASIYWHAAGYGVDEAKSPELVEHFGISTVEAIASHTLPLVYKAGGQTEIVKHDDLLWTIEDELINKTIKLATHNFGYYESSLDITSFSESAFTNTLKSLV